MKFKIDKLIQKIEGETMGDAFKDIDMQLRHEKRKKRLKNMNEKETTGSEPQANDFVRLDNTEVLLFIQEKSREKNSLERELEETQTTYDDELKNIKNSLLDSDEVIKYSTQKERLLKLDNLAEKQINPAYLDSVSEIKSKLYNINNEVNLAVKMYKLKNLI